MPAGYPIQTAELAARAEIDRRYLVIKRYLSELDRADECPVCQEERDRETWLLVAAELREIIGIREGAGLGSDRERAILRAIVGEGE